MSNHEKLSSALVAAFDSTNAVQAAAAVADVLAAVVAEVARVSNAAAPAVSQQITECQNEKATEALCALVAGGSSGQSIADAGAALVEALLVLNRQTLTG